MWLGDKVLGLGREDPWTSLLRAGKGVVASLALLDTLLLHSAVKCQIFCLSGSRFRVSRGSWPMTFLPFAWYSYPLHHKVSHQQPLEPRCRNLLSISILKKFLPSHFYITDQVGDSSCLPGFKLKSSGYRLTHINYGSLLPTVVRQGHLTHNM
jgi:hypothetical protein